MSRAFQCDRCQKFFSPTQMLPGDIFVTLKDFHDQDATAYENNKIRNKYQDYHLCPVCTANFYAFMNGLKDVAKNSTP